MEPTPVYSCKKTDLIGFPEHHDPVWDQLPKMILKKKVTGESPRLSTVVSSFWTESSLFFRFVCEDDYIVSTMSNHDDPIYKEDVVEVFLGETNELTDYKEFELSPANVQFDAIIHNQMKGKLDVKTEWHATNWRTSVYIGPGQKQVVYVWELPFINFTGGKPDTGDRWLMNCYRIDRGRTKAEDEYCAWSPTGIANFHTPQRFGTISFE